VRILTQKFETYKKENNHIITRRKYQHEHIKQHVLKDTYLPNDEVNNGGYFKKFTLLD
jgi:hypothetical protein